MNDIPLEIISSIAKRAWKFSFIFLFYFFISIAIFLTIFIHQNLFLIDNLIKINSNLYSILSFLLTSSFISIFIYFLIWVLKGESDIKIKKLRKNFYQKAINRVNEILKYRFDLKGFNEDIINLTEYHKEFIKNNNIHKINLKNFSFTIVDGVDTLYFFYKINEKEKIIWSIWHSGDFIAIAIAIEKNLVKVSNTKKYFEKFNLTSAKDYILTTRDKYIWFDVKYDVSEEFLINNVEKEKLSRWIAHFVSIGIIVGLEIMGWKKLESYLAED